MSRESRILAGVLLVVIPSVIFQILGATREFLRLIRRAE